MLAVEGLVVHYGEVEALDGVNLVVGEGEVVCVLGPSGCGKSTLLRTITGLEVPTAGKVSWDGRDLAHVAVHRRGFGLVFQDYALFPHRDVAANVAFGLRMRGTAGPELKARVEEALALVGLAGYGNRSVGALSGGEQQRVALARSLAPRPALLLLDEPFGSLDRALRERLVGELRSILDASGLTAVHVTHDQEEAFALGDRVVVMRSGRVVQAAPPEEVWNHPADEGVARLLGFDMTDAIVGRDGIAASPFGPLVAPAGSAPGPVRLVVRPDSVSLSPAGSLSGVVVERTFRGDHFRLRVALTGEGRQLEAMAFGPAAPALGARVHLTIDTARVSFFPQ